jgi:hypothetical protein
MALARGTTRANLDDLRLSQLGTVVLLTATQAFRLRMGPVPIASWAWVRLRVGHV